VWSSEQTATPSERDQSLTIPGVALRSTPQAVVFLHLRRAASCENPIPKPSVDKRPNHFALRKSRVGIRSILMASSNSVTCSGVTDTSRAGDVVLELGGLACTDDGDNWHRPMSQPSQRETLRSRLLEDHYYRAWQAQQDFPELTREDINARFAFAEGRI
jgi:hypothetical protein